MSENRVKRTLIMGAAGRDFHNFNIVYREDPETQVVAFTAAQIPDIARRRYPASLAGERYPEGIPILEESALESIIQAFSVDQVVFSYSDISHRQVMHMASRVMAAGADFLLLGPARTQLESRLPVIAVSAVRTGCGKSPISRWISALLQGHDLKVGVVRHPMPYGDLEKQRAQRFASANDLSEAQCTVEEREEYEPHLAMGSLVYGGVDYAEVLALAEQEADIIVWDGGNNDFPFIRPDLHIVLVDALRPGHERSHHPGETVLRLADVVVVTKTDVATPDAVEDLVQSVHALNPTVPVIRAELPITVDHKDRVAGRRVLVVEDGPTTTHGGMAFGAGYVAAKALGAAEIVDPRRTAASEIQSIYEQYPHIGPVLPAVGYHPVQLEALRATIAASDADVVVLATPCDLTGLIEIEKPVVKVSYGFREKSEPGLREIIDRFVAEQMTEG